MVELRCQQQRPYDFRDGMIPFGPLRKSLSISSTEDPVDNINLKSQTHFRSAFCAYGLGLPKLGQ